MGDPENHEHEAVSRWRARLKTASTAGFRLTYLDEGLGDTVVFLHGIPTQAFVWRDVVAIVEREYRCVAPDLLGFGFSDRPASADLSPRGQAEMIEGLLSELGVASYAIVAHDYGALVAAELVARNQARVTGVVLSNTSLWREDWTGSRLSPFALLRIPVVGEVAFAVARPFMLRQAFALYVEEDQRLTDDIMAVYWRPFTDGFSDVLLRLARDRRMTDSDFHDWRAALNAYIGPSLVVWGGKDPTFTTRRGQEISALMARSRFERFEHANHFVQEDRPEAFGRLIVAFLRGELPL